MLGLTLLARPDERRAARGPPLFIPPRKTTIPPSPIDGFPVDRNNLALVVFDLLVARSFLPPARALPGRPALRSCAGLLLRGGSLQTV
jgi:hypothetical protein